MTRARVSRRMSRHACRDRRCNTCHDDPREFARRFLHAVDDRPVCLLHRDDLDVFLRSHRMSDEWIARIVVMPKAQVTAGPLFSAHAATAAWPISPARRGCCATAWPPVDRSPICCAPTADYRQPGSRIWSGVSNGGSARCRPDIDGHASHRLASRNCREASLTNMYWKSMFT